MTKQEIVERIQGQIDRLEATIAKVNSHVPDNIPDDIQISPGYFGGQFWARMRIGSPSLGILRRQLGREWTFDVSHFYPEDGERITTYVHRDGTEFIFCLKAPIEGQSCKLVKVGEKVINQYEIVCS